MAMREFIVTDKTKTFLSWQWLHHLDILGHVQKQIYFLVNTLRGDFTLNHECLQTIQLSASVNAV